MSRGDSNPRAIIAEDEDVLREQLREGLSAMWPELKIIAEVEDGVAALRALETDTPDILFLDIQMPVVRHGGRPSCERSLPCRVRHRLRQRGCRFDEGAVDYVLKPFSPTRLATTIARLSSEWWDAGEAGGPPRKAHGDIERRARPSALDHRVAGQRCAPDHR
jgi:DNA-binding LytR/AlgR family response regulator